MWVSDSNSPEYVIFEVACASSLEIINQIMIHGFPYPQTLD